MSDRVFVDTNVLVYAHDTSTGARHEQARSLVERLWILYSEDLNEGQVYDSVRVVNPFRSKTA